MSATDHLNMEAATCRSQAEQERQNVMLVASLGLKPMQDGNQWCFLWGDNLQVGIAGFGDTVMAAIYAFNHAVYHERAGQVGERTAGEQKP